MVSKICWLSGNKWEKDAECKCIICCCMRFHSVSNANVGDVTLRNRFDHPPIHTAATNLRLDCALDHPYLVSHNNNCHVNSRHRHWMVEGKPNHALDSNNLLCNDDGSVRNCGMYCIVCIVMRVHWNILRFMLSLESLLESRGQNNTIRRMHKPSLSKDSTPIPVVHQPFIALGVYWVYPIMLHTIDAILMIAHNWC